MKYIENPVLSHLAQSLTHEGPECSVHTRLEAYSCKNVKRDKKLFKSLEHAYQDEVSHSPPFPSWLAFDREVEMTPFGPIDRQGSRKTFYLLISTLNVAFPDYDFSDVHPSHFHKEESGAGVLNALSNTFVSPPRIGNYAPRSYSSYPPTSSDFFPSPLPASSPSDLTTLSPRAPPPIVTGTHPTLFRLVDEVIGLSDCEVYRYTPDIDSDPYANDFSDEEDDIASIADEDDSSDDAVFEFDSHDIEDSTTQNCSEDSRGALAPREESDYFSEDDSPYLRTCIRLKRRGALLWSSHWFFLNRKLKRILYISVCARSRGVGRTTMDDYSLPSTKVIDQNERFYAWDGAYGAGARALGLEVPC